MSDSVRPHRRQPTRLCCPWDSPGKNTGVGCHFLLQCMKVKRESEVAQLCSTLRHPMDYSLPGSSIHGIFQARVLEWGAIAFSINLTKMKIQESSINTEAHRQQEMGHHQIRDGSKFWNKDSEWKSGYPVSQTDFTAWEGEVNLPTE